MPKGRAKVTNKKVLNKASRAAGSLIDNIVTLTKGGRAQSTNKEDSNHASVTDEKSNFKGNSFNQSDLKGGTLNCINVCQI